MPKIFVTKSPQETKELGMRTLMRALDSCRKDKPLIFWLEGELGAGKTYFVKGLAEMLGIKTITSPTFVLMKKFRLTGVLSRDGSGLCGKKYFFHIDCYRIYDSEDARQIGLDKILSNHRAIVAVEWAERTAELIVRPYWKVEFNYSGENERKIKVNHFD